MMGDKVCEGKSGVFIKESIYILLLDVDIKGPLLYTNKI